MSASEAAERPGESSSSGGGYGVFATTHWSVVLSARDDSDGSSAEALEKLCRTYWYPLYAFVRRSGHSVSDAQDLTQGFFARLLDKKYLHAATPARGRFRTFLLTALKGYMANEWDRAHAAKRGGFAEMIPINLDLAESKLAEDSSTGVQPDLWFDRQWAMTLLNSTLAKLQEEYAVSGRAALFEHLRDSLGGEPEALPYSEIAARLHLSEAAVKMAVYRLRSRYREILRSEITHTVGTESDAEAELQHLFTAFRR